MSNAGRTIEECAADKYATIERWIAAVRGYAKIAIQREDVIFEALWWSAIIANPGDIAARLLADNAREQQHLMLRDLRDISAKLEEMVIKPDADGLIDITPEYHEPTQTDLEAVVRAEFRDELAALINSHSKENGSNTPDFLLAKFLEKSLALFDEIVVARESWYGRSTDGSCPTEIGIPDDAGNAPSER